MEAVAERTTYAVRGWGSGELWTRRGVVLAHDFRFSAEGDAPAHGNGPAEGPAVALAERLAAFLAGEEASLADVALDLGWATLFQRAVTDALRAIPRGEVVSYGELAALAGYPGAQRAVGTYCAQNRFMFLVPCHRVVAAGGIGGYGSAGVGVKRRLLALEDVAL